MSYLEETFDFSDPEYISSHDHLSYWSSIAGQMLLEYVPLGNSVRVLDLGCGTGFPSIELAQRLGTGSRVVGIDLWELGLARAQQKKKLQRITNVEFIRGDANDIPFDNHSFDMLVSNLGINIFRDRQKTIQEAYRVLKENGVCVLTSNTQGQMSDFYAIYKTTLEEMGYSDMIPGLDGFINHPVSLPQLDHLLRDAGFEISKTHEKNHKMRFFNGTAMLNHHFIKTGFMYDWHKFLPKNQKKQIFVQLEDELNKAAMEKGELVLDFPIIYVEARKAQ